MGHPLYIIRILKKDYDVIDKLVKVGLIQFELVSHQWIAPPPDPIVSQSAASGLLMSAHFAIAPPTGLIVIQSAANDLLMSAHFAHQWEITWLAAGIYLAF